MKNPDKVKDKRDGITNLLNQEPRETTISSTDQLLQHQKMLLSI